MLKKLICLSLIGGISLIGVDAMAGDYSCPTTSQKVGCIVVPKNTYCCKTHAKGGHNGVDLPNSKGTLIVAARKGKVIQRRDRGDGYGNTIVIQHTNPSRITRYAHLDSYVAKLNSEPKEKETIAKMGSTGNSTGPHLHWEVRSDTWGTVYSIGLTKGNSVSSGSPVSVKD